MAALIGWLAGAGSRLADGTPNASGRVLFMVPGIEAQAAVYGDPDGLTILAQPVVLDASGKATVYTKDAVTVRVYDANTTTPALVSEQFHAVDSRAESTEIEHGGYTGILPDGSRDAGGATNLHEVLSSAQTSLGGHDFKYMEAVAATHLNVAAWMSDMGISVKTRGARGDNASDDLPGIQAAANRCASRGGGVLYFPPGVYRLGTGAVTIPDTVSIKGAGPAVSIIYPMSNIGALFFDVCSKFFVEDIGIGNPAGGTGLDGIGVRLTGCSFYSINRVGIVGARYGIYINDAGVDVGGVCGHSNIHNCVITTTNRAPADTLGRCLSIFGPVAAMPVGQGPHSLSGANILTSDGCGIQLHGRMRDFVVSGALQLSGLTATMALGVTFGTTANLWNVFLSGMSGLGTVVLPINCDAGAAITHFTEHANHFTNWGAVTRVIQGRLGPAGGAAHWGSHRFRPAGSQGTAPAALANGAYSPSLVGGAYHRWTGAVAGGAITVNAPLDAEIADGTPFTLVLQNEATMGTTWTIGAPQGYICTAPGAGAAAINKYVFTYNATTGLWDEMSYTLD